MKAHSLFLVATALLGLAYALGATSPAWAAQVRLLPLSDVEKADLVYMREEEKLARDVYLTLSAKWNIAVFANIAASEQTHMNTVATLLSRYGITDPVAGKGVGEFATDKFKSLYAELVTRGSQSVNDALAVGAAIEEIDIVDLWECLSVARHADIVQVYRNLEGASENHLRAFVGLLSTRGVTYQPQYLTPEQYASIVTR